jgi:hypothetical protein
MHPEFVWETYPLCDYEQYSIGNSPKLLVCFSNKEIHTCEYIPDPFSTLFGSKCLPSHWKLSFEGAELIRDHNQISVVRALAVEKPAPEFNIKQA